MKVTTKSGRTPLTLAARKAGNSRTVKLLLDKGADAKERNDRGVNPIQVAAACGDLDTVKLLVEAGADVNDFTAVPGAFSLIVRTPLGWAAYHNDLPMVRYLLEHKADPKGSMEREHPAALGGRERVTAAGVRQTAADARRRPERGIRRTD